EREAGSAKRLLQFRLLDPQPLLYHNEPIWHDDVLVGHVTSGAYGHTLGGAIGLGYVDTLKVPDPVEGSFNIEVAGERVPAEVSSRPMYDPANRRIRC
ncbi:MAG: aminomethyl transferase family protein, partial [Proteobacteria bacterium]|nr:aminomethyl transferase family protein [Pseudomonadota bacterium]